MKRARSNRIEARDSLRYALCEAAELEHALLCQYLFAALSLKSHPEEGVSWPQLEMIRGWKKDLLLIARQEMEHLGHVCNLLTAIGSGPHFRIPAFPIPSRLYPAGVALELLPFGETALERFLHLERPPGARFETLSGALAPAAPAEVRLTRPVSFHTIGELYGEIRRAFKRLDERRLFIGPESSQVSTVTLGLGDKGYYDIRIAPIEGRASALAAIDQIVAEGEGTPHAKPGALARTHFGRLRRIREELQKERAASARAQAAFEPARPVVANPASYEWGDNPGATIVERASTRQVLDLFNYAYQTMLLMLMRFYVNEDETDREIASLQRTAFWPLMTMVIRPLGEILTRLPATDRLDGPTAGPGFHVLRSLTLLPHRSSAWVVLHERLQQMASHARHLDCFGEDGVDPRVLERLRLLSRDLSRIAVNFQRLLRSTEAQ